MSPSKADTELDNLIWEITVDCHDEDEQLVAFENAFDEANLPGRGTVIGETVQVLSVHTTNHRRELIAAIQRGSHRYEVALLDIQLDADPTPHGYWPHTDAGSAPE